MIKYQIERHIVWEHGIAPQSREGRWQQRRYCSFHGNIFLFLSLCFITERNVAFNCVPRDDNNYVWRRVQMFLTNILDFFVFKFNKDSTWISSIRSFVVALNCIEIVAPERAENDIQQRKFCLHHSLLQTKTLAEDSDTESWSNNHVNRALQGALTKTEGNEWLKLKIYHEWNYLWAIQRVARFHLLAQVLQCWKLWEMFHLNKMRLSVCGPFVSILPLWLEIVSFYPKCLVFSSSFLPIQGSQRLNSFKFLYLM